MAEDIDPESKTEDPTPRRREEARRQGQVPFSAELVGSLVLLAGVIGLSNFGTTIGTGMLNVFRYDLAHPLHGDFSTDGAQALIIAVLIRMLTVLVPLFVLLLAVGVATSIAQVGFQVNTDKLEFKLDKLNPATGWQRLFSMSALFRGFLTILKVVALGAVAYWVVQGRGGIITNVGRDRLPGAVMSGWAVVMRLATFMTAAVAAVAVIDYIYQRRKFERGLRMSRQELKDELKSEEGDPQIKARIRQIQRERMKQKMLSEVPKATVVITNPSHYAVALRYESGRDTAPVLVAKGIGLIARRIGELAREHDVPVLERPTLARAIYSGVREGQPIPGPLFRAVAEVLAFVYRMRGIGPVVPVRG